MEGVDRARGGRSLHRRVGWNRDERRRTTENYLERKVGQLVRQREIETERGREKEREKERERKREYEEKYMGEKIERKGNSNLDVAG